MLILAAIATIALTWNIVQAGDIAQQRRTPPPLAAFAGLAVLLAIPALLIAVATSSAITGHSVAGVAWIWPVTTIVFLTESVYVTARRLVTPLVGVPIALYNAFLLTVAVTRYVQEGGGTPPDWALASTAAYTDAIGALAGPVVLSSRWATLVPLIAPAFPARRATARTARALVALLSAGSVGAVVAWWPAGNRAVQSYDRYLTATLQERPAGDFAVGVQILPPLDGVPPTAALHNDLALVDTIGAEAVSIIIDPDGVHAAILDSLARALDPLRRDSTSVFVTLASRRTTSWASRASAPALDRDRFSARRTIARRLHPDYFILAETESFPNGARRASGAVSPMALAAAADSIHMVDRHTKVAIVLSAFDARDSTLYAWASAPACPIDVVGFTLFPALNGAATLDEHMRTIDRWTQRLPGPPKEQWVITAGGYPAAHGESAQQMAIWGTLAWATSRGAMKGAIIADAADYEAITGLRAANGRLRPAANAVMRATKELRERRN